MRYKIQRSPFFKKLEKSVRQLRRYLIAEYRLLRIILREFRLSLSVLIIVTTISTVLIHYYYPRTEPVTWGESLYHTLTAIEASPVLAYPASSKLQWLFLLLPVFGVLLLADTIARLGSLIFQRRSQNKEWQILMASTYSNHVIVCGLGHVGYRVVNHLIKNGFECVGIEMNESPLVDELRHIGIPVIISDARSTEVLQQANIAEACAVIVATNNDLANLEVALDARGLRPDIRIVLRLFDEKLAQKITKGFNIHCAFSTSAIAAPIFAAAVTEKNVINSFVFNDKQLNTVEITISENSRLIGWTLDRLRQELELTIALYQKGEEMDWNPSPEIELNPGVKLLVITTADSLQDLQQLNRAPNSTKTLQTVK